MKKIHLILLIFFLFLFSFILSEVFLGKETEIIENALVQRVIDGDTIELSNGERVRLIGINAPEKKEECFEEATEKLKELVLGKKIEMKRDVSEKDGFGRLVRYVYIEGEFVNELMVREGFAFSYKFEPDTKYLRELEEAERIARENKKGCLWQN